VQAPDGDGETRDEQGERVCERQDEEGADRTGEDPKHGADDEVGEEEPPELGPARPALAYRSKTTSLK